jgi:hypothetical protein
LICLSVSRPFVVTIRVPYSRFRTET